MACEYCFPEGEYFDDSLEIYDRCCRKGFRLLSTETYCGACLPDAYWTFDSCTDCCSGICYQPAGFPVAVCGLSECQPAGAACAFGAFCCSGTCSVAGICD